MLLKFHILSILLKYESAQNVKEIKDKERLKYTPFPFRLFLSYSSLLPIRLLLIVNYSSLEAKLFLSSLLNFENSKLEKNKT